MKRLLPLAIGALLSALIFYGAVTYFSPRMSFGAAFNTLAPKRDAMNTWIAMPRADPNKQRRTRPDMDFATFVCAYDLNQGPVRIEIAPWDEYWTLSLYDDTGALFFSRSDRESGYRPTLFLARPNDRTQRWPSEAVVSPSKRGLAVLRLLAPTVQSHQLAGRAARENVCAPTPNPEAGDE